MPNNTANNDIGGTIPADIQARLGLDSITNNIPTDMQSSLSLLDNNLDNSQLTQGTTKIAGDITNISSQASNKIKGTLTKIRDINPLGIWVQTTLTYTIIVLVSVFVNCNITYLFKYAQHASKGNLIDLWFPSECNKPPFGTKEIKPCDVESAKINQVRCQSIKVGGGPGDVAAPISVPEVAAPVVSGGDAGSVRYSLYRYFYKDNTSVEFPYNRYHKTFNPSVLLDTTNWFIGSVATTSIGVNRNLKEVFNSSINSIPDYLLFIFGILILLIVPLIFLNTLFRLMYNQVLGLSKVAYWRTFFLIIIALPLNTVVWDLMYSIYKMVLLIIKLTCYPFLMGEWTELAQVFNKYKNFIVYMIGFSSIYALWKTPFAEEYALPVRLIPTLFYISFILIKIVEFVTKRKIL